LFLLANLMIRERTMTRAIEWTSEMEKTLCEMRAEGCSCSEIAAALEISKNAVINRCDRLGMVTGARFRRLQILPRIEDRDEAPLPPGHPVSWGAITAAQWPGLYA
jgi:DNA-binding CsgD family transcriptional regulator